MKILIYWLLNVAVNDMSAMYVTTHRCVGGMKSLTYGWALTFYTFDMFPCCIRPSTDVESPFIRLFPKNQAASIAQ